MSEDVTSKSDMPSDTTPAAQRVYEQAIARLTPDQRVAITMEMIAVTDDLVRAGVRLRHPEATGEEFEYQFLRAKYGAELAGRVYGRPW
jgi:ketosteroid isomerase-like protein